MFWYSLRANVLPEDAVSDALLGSNYVVRIVTTECVIECVKNICMKSNKYPLLFMAPLNALASISNVMKKWIKHNA